jgi:hypothetical protein
VRRIERAAFNDCTSLFNITLPNGVANLNILEGCFMGISSENRTTWVRVWQNSISKSIPPRDLIDIQPFVWVLGSNKY